MSVNAAKNIHAFDIKNFEKKDFTTVKKYGENHPFPTEGISDHSEVRFRIIVNGIEVNVKFCNIANPEWAEYLGEEYGGAFQKAQIYSEKNFKDAAGKIVLEKIKGIESEMIADSFQSKSAVDVFGLCEVRPDVREAIENKLPSKVAVERTTYCAEDGRDIDQSVVLFNSNTINQTAAPILYSEDRPYQGVSFSKKNESFSFFSMHVPGCGGQYHEEKYTSLVQDVTKYVNDKFSDGTMIMVGDWNTPESKLQKFGEDLGRALPNHQVKVLHTDYLTHITPKNDGDDKNTNLAARYDACVVVSPKGKKVEASAADISEIGLPSQQFVNSIK